MQRAQQEARSQLQQPLLQNGGQQQQQQQQQRPRQQPSGTSAPPAAPASENSRGAAGLGDMDSLTKWGPIVVVILVLFICAAFAGTIMLLSGGPGGDPPPLGRKGCAAAVIGDRQVMLHVLGDAEAAVLDKKHPRSEPGPRLLVWGGKGRHQAIFDDLYELDLIKGRWRRMAPRAESENKALAAPYASSRQVHSPEAARRLLDMNISTVASDNGLASAALGMPPEDGLPRGRWKMVSAGIPTRHGDGMVVFGGDTLVKGENGGDYLNDVWLLQPKPHGAETAVWHPSTASDSDDGPEGRRAAAGAVWHGPGQTTPPKLLVHGGRNRQGDQLNDLWSASLEWPDVTWSLLDDGISSGPEPRKGHTATLRPGPAAHLLVYGGRNEVDYFDDLWAYDLEFNSWEQWLPPGSGGPMGRDHHSAVVVGNQFIIYGGRGGPSHDESKILSDMWSLDLTTMNWTEVKTAEGPQPPARFLHSFDMFLPPKAANNSLRSHPAATKGQGFARGPAAVTLSNQVTGPNMPRQAGVAAPAATQSLRLDVADSALKGALMQDERQLTGRRLLGSNPGWLAGRASNGSTLEYPAQASTFDGAEDNDGSSSDGGVADESFDDSEDDDSDEDESGAEEDDEREVLTSAPGSKDRNASSPAISPRSSDVDKHHHHHKQHHKKHHKHSSKHGHDEDHHHENHHKEKKKGKHGKHHRGGVDPDPAQGSYSDAKLVVFGGQGEFGCYLNDAWEFNPITSTWRQISPIRSDDRKCIPLENAARAQNNLVSTGFAAGLRWLSAGRAL